MYHINSGIFSITKMKVLFCESNDSVHNRFSAILLLSVIAEFQSGSNTLFQENLGYNGGALAMYGFSKIVLNSYSTVTFSRNRAT